MSKTKIYYGKKAKCGSLPASFSRESAELMRQDHERTCPWCMLVDREAQVKELADALEKCLKFFPYVQGCFFDDNTPEKVQKRAQDLIQKARRP